jgi:hypothetical protein
MLPLAIGLGVGALQGLQQQNQAEKDRKLAAITAQYSPWTHMAPQPVKEANMTGALASGALQGYGLGQNMDAASAYNNKNNAEAGFWNQMAQQQAGTPQEADMPEPQSAQQAQLQGLGRYARNRYAGQ